MIAGLDTSELHLLSFNEVEITSELRWKHEDEFEFKGFMYDIVKREKVGDSYLFWCWKDDEETALNKKLDQLLADIFSHNPNDRQTHKNLLQFYASVYFVNAKPWQPTNPSFKMEKPQFTYINHYQSLGSSPNAPPPLV